MRLISQDGNSDIPYENVLLSVNEERNTILAVYADGAWELGQYPNMDRVKEVLQEIRNCTNDYYYFPQFS